MRAMILAAGRGERLRPLTDSVPKPLLTVAGHALIEYHLSALHDAGVSEIVVNVSWLAEKIMEALGDGSRYGVQITYSLEPEGALETAGGIAKALPLLGAEPFWVVNADIFTDFRFDWAKDSLPAEVDARLLLAANPAHHKNGDFTLDGNMAGHSGKRANALTYCGAGIFRPRLFQGIRGRKALGPLLFQAADQQRVQGVHYLGTWDDIGTLARLRARRRQLGDDSE